MEVGPLLGEHLGGGAAGLPVRAAVHLLAERSAGPLQLLERVVGRQQVGPGGHQVGLGQPHRGLRAPLGLGVGGDAGGEGDAVVPADLHDLRVPDRDARHVGRGHGPLVVGGGVGGGAAEAAERGVDRRDERGERLVQDGEHHPVARPGEPGAEQVGGAGPGDHPSSRTGTTSPARGSTAGRCVGGRPGRRPWPPPPPGGSCAPSPRSRGPGACGGRYRRGSCRGSAPPTPRSSP